MITELVKHFASQEAVVFHWYLQEFEQLCDKLVLLNEGRLIYQGTVQGILEAGQSLERFYLDFLNKAGTTC